MDEHKRQHQNEQLETKDEELQFALSADTYAFWFNDEDEEYERRYRGIIENQRNVLSEHPYAFWLNDEDEYYERKYRSIIENQRK
jgi:PIN domain nuclease of toxin-antitoxin system